MKNKNITVQKPTKAELQTSLNQAKQKPVRRFNKRTRRLALRFSPTAWAKLLYFRDKSDNEVGGFGVTGPDDLLCVQEFLTVKQQVTVASVKFDDQAVADFFEDQVDLGRKPEQFARIWLHSHPSDCPEPSSIDEDTFDRVFGDCEWAIMFIVAEGNRTYVKLSFNVGPGGQLLIPVEVDYSCEFGPTNKEAWDVEYQANVKPMMWLNGSDGIDATAKAPNDYSSLAVPYDFLDEFEKMEPQERQFILDELADRPELWDEESEVMLL